jgi:DHA1 family multidrug resistance protein-like MFS transporter
MRASCALAMLESRSPNHDGSYDGEHLAVAVSRTLVGAVIFAVAVAAFSRIPLLPDIGRDLSLTTGEIGLLTTAFGLGRLLTDLPAGRLTDAIAPSVALAGAGVGLAVSCALLAVSGSMVEALIASALIGCASALTNTTGMYSFATATSADRRGASMALYTGALMSGQMMGPALGGAIGSLTGWRSALWIAAAIGLCVAVACLVWRRRTRGPAGERESRMARAAAAAAAEDAETRGPPPTRSELIALAAAPFASFFALAGLTQTLIPVIGDGELGFAPSTIGLAIALGAAARFATAWGAGVGSDRLSRKVVLVPSLLLMAVGAGALALPPTTATWLAAIVLIALGSSAVSVAAAAVADRVPRERLGHELGLFRLIGDLGLLLGPATAGFLYQESGGPLAGSVSAAVFLAAAAAVALSLREPRRPGPGRHEPRDESGDLLVE